MNLKPLLFILPLLLALHVDAITEEFRISQVGSDKSQLLAVFTAIKSLEEGRTGNVENSSSFKVLQRLSPTEFLVYKVEWVDSVTSSYSASYGGGGGVYASRALKPDTSKVYCLQLRYPYNAVDGDIIKNIVAYETSDIKAYTSTIGAQKSVRIIVDGAEHQRRQEMEKRANTDPFFSLGGDVPKGKTLPSDTEFTKEEFVARLRNGETWTLKDFTTESCRRCFGDGRLSDLQAGKRCLECNGKGTQPVDLLIRW